MQVQDVLNLGPVSVEWVKAIYVKLVATQAKWCNSLHQLVQVGFDPSLVARCQECDVFQVGYCLHELTPNLGYDLVELSQYAVGLVLGK